MMINILIEEPYVNLLDPDKLEQAAQAALDYVNIQDGVEISIVVDSDERLQELK